MEYSLQLMEKTLTSLAKSHFRLLRLTTALSTTNATI